MACKMYKNGKEVKMYKDGGSVKPSKKPKRGRNNPEEVVKSSNRVSKMEAEAAKAMKKKEKK